jgi:hypothetical protein
LDPPPPQQISYASYVSYNGVLSDVCPRSRDDCQSELHLYHDDVDVVQIIRMRKAPFYELVKRFRERERFVAL